MQLRRHSFFNKTITILALLAFFSQGFASHASSHNHYPINSIEDTQANHELSMHSNHDMHPSSEHLALELNSESEHQCCEQKCDCDVAHCSLLFLLSTDHHLHTSFTFDTTPSLVDDFTSILRPSLFRPPIYI